MVLSCGRESRSNGRDRRDGGARAHRAPQNTKEDEEEEEEEGFLIIRAAAAVAAAAV